MLQINNETAHAMFYKLMERFDKIEKMLERQNKMKECLDGDTLLDNYDLSKLLGVTHRTLARYRHKASEVKDFFEQKGLPLPASMRNNPNV